MKNHPTEKFVTIAQLRKWLDEHEADWSKEDIKYMGEFSDQLVLMWVPQRGYAPTIAHPTWEFGGFLLSAIGPDGEELK